MRGPVTPNGIGVATDRAQCGPPPARPSVAGSRRTSRSRIRRPVASGEGYSRGRPEGKRQPASTAAGRRTGPSVGRMNQKVEPVPGIESAPMVPPCISTNRLRQGEPESGALRLPAGGGVHLGELLEQLGHVLRSNSDSRIDHAHPDDVLRDHPRLIGAALGRHRQRGPRACRRQGDGAAIAGELRGVGQEVEEDLPDPDAIGDDDAARRLPPARTSQT